MSKNSFQNYSISKWSCSEMYFYICPVNHCPFHVFVLRLVLFRFVRFRIVIFQIFADNNCSDSKFCISECLFTIVSFKQTVLFHICNFRNCPYFDVSVSEVCFLFLKWFLFRTVLFHKCPFRKCPFSGSSFLDLSYV